MHSISGLGEVVGRPCPDYPTITQFLGIPYGRIPRRWDRALAVTDLGEGSINCTTFGYDANSASGTPINAFRDRPKCPQPQYTVRQALCPGAPDDPVVPHDEFGCLNLNITLPHNYGKLHRMPVMVFIHGISSAQKLVFGWSNLIGARVQSDQIPRTSIRESLSSSHQY
jgi:hypothetical protein